MSIKLIFALLKPFINQNENWLPAIQTLISLAHMKEHLCRIKMIPNLSIFVQHFPKKSSGKIIIGVIQRAPPAATANATADAMDTTKNANTNADAMDKP